MGSHEEQWIVFQKLGSDLKFRSLAETVTRTVKKRPKLPFLVKSFDRFPTELFNCEVFQSKQAAYTKACVPLINLISSFAGP